MTREEFAALKPGDKVRIVKEKGDGEWNSAGVLNKWLGEVMTVRGKNKNFLGEVFLSMEEDRKEYCGDGWSWYRDMIECKVEDAPAEAKDKKEEDPYIDQLVMEREETMEIPRADLRKRFLTELTGERGPFTWSDFGVEFTQRWDEVSLEMVMECFDRAMEEEE